MVMDIRVIKKVFYNSMLQLLNYYNVAMLLSNG
jgi:hypothetical protein